MFDPAACCRIHFATSPAVNCEALLELKRLLSAVAVASSDVVLQAEHHSLAFTGGADATLIKPTAGDSTQPVSALSEDIAMGAVATGGAATHDALVGATATLTSPMVARRRSRKGGGR